MSLALTIFTTCKPFVGDFERIQRNAFRSWKELSPPCEVLVFGNESGVAPACDEFGFAHIPDVRRTGFGTPLMDDIFQQASARARHDYLAYVNADIIMMRDLLAATEKAAMRFERFLLIARRWNVHFDGRWDFERPDWERELRHYAAEHGKLEPPYGGVDLFVYPRGMWGTLPPFAIGRTRWDSALIYQARRLRLPVIDATQAVASIHQNHDYSHIPHGTPGVLKGPEAKRNEALLGGDEFIFTPLNATHALSARGIRRNRIFFPPYLLRRLAALPALHGIFRPFKRPVSILAPYWRNYRKRLHPQAADKHYD